jgi:hypothetical protein
VRHGTVLLLLTRVAAADPAPIEPADPSSEEPPVTARDVRGAPVPGEESGRVDHEPGEGVARKLGRAVLWVPRIPIVLALKGARGAFYLQDRYNVAEIADEFQTEDKKIAFFPSAFAETGFGLNVGIRASLTDLISEERISGRVGIGGRHRWIADLEVARRLGPVDVSLSGRREARDNDLFFGYGNTDVTSPEMPLDPLTADVGASARFRSRLLRGMATASIKLPQHFSLTATTAVVRRELAGTDTADSIDTLFDVSALPGFVTNTTYLHSELTVAWDTRRRASRWDGHGVRSAGGLVLGFADYQHGLAGEPDFVRYGMDLQRIVQLARGPRLLELRLYGEAVTGRRDEVPFTELPRLGGSNLLRGYVAGRFRDRLAAVGQVRYLWPALSWLAPSIFVDAGRVWASYDELSLRGLRVGFGGGIEVYGRGGLAMRAELATSIDGGVTGVLLFEPAFNTRMEHH